MLREITNFEVGYSFSASGSAVFGLEFAIRVLGPQWRCGCGASFAMYGVPVSDKVDVVSLSLHAGSMLVPILNATVVSSIQVFLERSVCHWQETMSGFATLDMLTT